MNHNHMNPNIPLHTLNSLSFTAFEILHDHIDILSTSGSHYSITKDSCSCKGHSIRHSCRHFKDAKTHGLIDLLLKPVQSRINLNSQHIIKSRKQALSLFLTSHSITPTQTIIDALEPKITPTMKPQELINLANTLANND